MPKPPVISGEKAISAFRRAGFAVVRITGSHHIMKKVGHPNRLSVPVHKGKTVGLGLLEAQIEAAGLTIEEFGTGKRLRCWAGWQSRLAFGRVLRPEFP